MTKSKHSKKPVEILIEDPESDDEHYMGEIHSEPEVNDKGGVAERLGFVNKMYQEFLTDEKTDPSIITACVEKICEIISLL